MEVINTIFFILLLTILLIILFREVIINKIKIYINANIFFILGVLMITIFVEFVTRCLTIGPLNIDTVIYKVVSNTINSNMNNIMLQISQFGLQGIITIFLVLIVSLLIIFKKKNIYWQMMIINFSAAVFLNQSIKTIFARPRPNILRLENVGGYSFPSGHAMISICFYGYIIYLILSLFKTKFKYILSSIFSLLILLIGYCRVYLGVHYFTDVLGGYILGLALSFISFSIVEYFSKKNKDLIFSPLILILGVFTTMQNMNTISLYFKILFISLILEIFTYFVVKSLLKYISILKIKDKEESKKVNILKCIPLIRTFIPYVLYKEKIQLLNFLKYNLTGGFIYVILYIFIRETLKDKNYINIYFTQNILILTFVLSIPLIIYYIVSKNKIKNEVHPKS